MTVQINEVIQVEISTSGIAGATLNGQWRLNEQEWKRLVQNKGDWVVVSVPIVTNAPVKQFDEYVRQKREPIRNRKAGFDDPIRKTLQSLRDGTYRTNFPSADCPEGLNCYERVVCYGGHDPRVKEFEAFFGSNRVDHLISKFGSKTQTPLWHSVTYFGGRYRVVMQFPVLINYKNCTQDGALNSPFIEIDEVVKVEALNSGSPRVKTKGHWELGENEWKWLLKNNGDWSVVKVPIVTNAPVNGFDQYVKHERARPLPLRQEDFDKPIKKGRRRSALPNLVAFRQ